MFPIRFEGNYYEGEDFVKETDVLEMLKSLLSFYICYQLRMCECNSRAAENVLRSQIISSAIKKIDEKEYTTGFPYAVFVSMSFRGLR